MGRRLYGPRPPRAIRFPKLVGRTYGYRSLPIALQPIRNFALPFHPRIHTSQPDEISEIASRKIIDTEIAPAPGRSYIAHTEDALNLGPTPNRIDRETPAANAGIINAGMPDGMRGWPYDGNALYIPHQVIPRKPITVTPFQRTLDTSVTIPAVPIGGPVS